MGNYQNKFLHDTIFEKEELTIYLISGIKLIGHIIAFDEDIIILESTTTMMIYKKAIATICPYKQTN